MKKMEQFIRKTWGIDPADETIGWYVNPRDDKEMVIWRFVYKRKEYRVTYNRKTKKLTGSARGV